MKYLILRPTLWFCKGDEVSVKNFDRYFTQEALTQLINYGFIQELWK
jgi:hypothetical protein